MLWETTQSDTIRTRRPPGSDMMSSVGRTGVAVATLVIAGIQSTDNHSTTTPLHDARTATVARTLPGEDTRPRKAGLEQQDWDRRPSCDYVAPSSMCTLADTTLDLGIGGASNSTSIRSHDA